MNIVAWHFAFGRVTRGLIYTAQDHEPDIRVVAYDQRRKNYDQSSKKFSNEM